MSENKWRNECIGMSSSEIVSNIIRNPLACPEAKQIARDELFIRLYFETTTMLKELKQKLGVNK